MTLDPELRSVIAGIEEWFGRDLDLFLNGWDAPVTVVGAAGTMVLADRAQAGAMFGALFSSLAEKGFERTTADTVRTRRLGDDLALVDAAFTRRRSDGSTLERVGALYVCRRVAGAWKIVALIPHPPDTAAL
ncbi:MAG TPA: hypothetical protein VFA11_14210 [Acidimicrobiales bacterium]|nr:hypothetical protein [Acidimicrobiales bacterium]